MTRWGYVAIATAAVVAVTAVALAPTTAAASPSDLTVSPDCSRIEIKSKTALAAKVGLAVLGTDTTDETPVVDVLVQVLRKVIPQCTWPPAAGANPLFAGLKQLGASEDEARWIAIKNALGGRTWGEVKQLGVLDFAPAPGTGADSQALAAGVALLDALARAADAGPEEILPLPNIGPQVGLGIPLPRRGRGF